ncbi:MAG TPA: glycosyltransferase [Usitatibacteraceae bacterium]|nr:glycosyltransferase [Usitatibacteraceae bacterium]HRA22470.1 glycosyltransferase [Usitatibacteraceae bacterium]
MRPPRFSIIMNVYNGERFLAEALASAFAQTLGDWELVFWDDRSTDGSAEVLARFPRDPRVRYHLAPERVALAPAREQAIAQARGEWLAFLDQDDVWTPDKLEKQARLIDADPGGRLAIVYGRAMKFGEVALERDYDHWHEFGELPSGDIFESLFVDSCYICQSAACLRTTAAREVLPFPAGIRCCPDYHLYAGIARRHSAACVQDVVCWYRVHGGGMSGPNYNAIHREAIAIAERWRADLDPAVLRRRLRIQHSMIGLHDVLSGADPAGGLARIARDGSFPYLLSRPFAIGSRGLRRLVRRALRPPPRRPAFS